ncbi:DUF421 domain-containing protein [Novosphingobium aquimarinum]|uniref:DUF421 domain-containing protein n=1 Tax=Novosphingobium aquimarinum TaxID=2682494 RepID=UPI0012EC7260|nr:YetF domain-containing protein [Novosphingobium aquimarinum]
MKDPQTWFESWDRIFAVVIAAVAVYLAIVVVVRISGKRTTANFNSFDWLITVTIGSLASSGILLPDIAVADALAAILTLTLCQYGITWAVRRSDMIGSVVKAEPLLLLNRGQVLQDNLDKARISVAELRAVLRGKGFADAEQAVWVVLETNGEVSVMGGDPSGAPKDHWATRDVMTGAAHIGTSG